MYGSRWRPTGNSLGGGGQAQVLVVVDISRARDGEYALKLLSDPRRSERIEREIKTATRMAAAGVPVLDVIDSYITSDPEARRPWFVTEIADGGNLRKHFVSEQPFRGTAETAVRFFIELATAVQSLHAQRIAHRDLKPENILLHADRVVLADLGLCLPIGDTDAERLTGVLERVGSLNYLPPEAFGRRPLDENQYAFDAYALGKLLYELVAGRQLPGFVSPNEPTYDLVLLKDTRLTRAVNRALRGLLHSTPSIRITTLTGVADQLNEVMAGPSEVNGADIGERLSRVSEFVARRINVEPAGPTDLVASGAEAGEVREHIYRIWETSLVTLRLREELVAPNASVLDVQVSPLSATIRQLVAAPLTRSHNGMEPLEDMGYPQRPVSEVGCCITVSTKDARLSLAAISLQAVVTTLQGNTTVGLAVVRKPASVTEPTDIVFGSANVLAGGSHDASFLNAIEKAASLGLSIFAERVINEVNSL